MQSTCPPQPVTAVVAQLPDITPVRERSCGGDLDARRLERKGCATDRPSESFAAGADYQ
jgi:hypothetical protein